MSAAARGKVLLLTYGCSVGGCEMHLLHLAQGLMARGWQIHLAYFRELSSGSRSLVREFTDLRVELHELGGVPWWHPRGWRELAALLRRERFSIVHSHLPGPDMVGGLVSWWLGLAHKRIVSVHNQRHRVGIDYPRWAIRQSWQTADRLVVISNAVRDYLERKIGIEPGRAQVIPYGLPQTPRVGEPFIRRELGIARKPLLLNVARLVPQKGQLCLIDAMPAVLREVPSCHLAIVGHAENGYATMLKRHIAERGLERNVHLLGYREMGMSAMAEADVFVFPSLWEGFGLAVIEAMRAGVPVVCSDRGPLREIVLDGETGLRVPPEDPASLAKSILEVLRSPALAARLAAAGERHVREMFDVERMIEQTQYVYLDALHESGGAA